MPSLLTHQAVPSTFRPVEEEFVSASNYSARSKQFVHTLLNRCGLDVRRYHAASGRMPSLYDRRRAMLMREHDITLVLDVGAGRGLYGVTLRDCGYQGRIVSFEPLPTSFSELYGRACVDEAWHAENVALGSIAAESNIHVAGNLDSSSLLPMARRHVQAAPFAAFTGQLVVRQATLDSFTDASPLDDERVMLKLDVQGYEQEVLKGAPETIEAVSLIDIELSLCTLYEGQALLPEMVATLYGLGFTAVAFADEFVEWDTGRTLQVNGLFERPLKS